ncbi:hypothetical protein ES703_59564 [subsurface metagenome]
MKYWDRYLRDREIVGEAGKLTVKELEAKFGVSARTIQRVLHRVDLKAKRKANATNED